MSSSIHRADRNPDRGFTLIEMLIAMMVVMMALLLGLGFLVEQPKIEARLERQQQVTREMEGWLERLRAGSIPIQPGELVLSEEPTRIELTIEKANIRDLFEVDLIATWRIQEHDFERRASTRVWRHASKNWD
jgi:prepilin-type N-terminal cleavage/methylation domain-containing protein